MRVFTLKSLIEAMEVGEVYEVRPDQATRGTLSMYACTLGKKLGREYKCSTIKSRGVYQIRREA